MLKCWKHNFSTNLTILASWHLNRREIRMRQAANLTFDFSDHVYWQHLQLWQLSCTSMIPTDIWTKKIWLRKTVSIKCLTFQVKSIDDTSNFDDFPEVDLKIRELLISLWLSPPSFIISTIQIPPNPNLPYDFSTDISSAPEPLLQLSVFLLQLLDLK